MPRPEPVRPGSLTQIVGYALVLVLAVLLAVWGSFLVPLRVGGVLAPVSWVIAAVGNAALVVAAGRLAGRLPALVPALLWLTIVTTLGGARSEGDRIVPGTLAGIGFLAVGTLSSVAAFAVVSARPRDQDSSRTDDGPTRQG